MQTVNLAQEKRQLKELSDLMLLSGDFHDALAPAIVDYTNLLFRLGDIDSGNEEQRKDIFTDTGKAIGPFWAAHCVREILRTQRFCRGVYKAIKDCLAVEKDKPVHVIYAGTGPFATLVLPCMMQFKPDELQFTLLEINPVSHAKLKELLNVLELNAYVKELVLTDASDWKIKETADIVISETMNGALRNEPQIAIMLNFASQLPEKTIFIPEEIGVNLSVQQTSGKPHLLKELFLFNQESYRDIIRRSHNGIWCFDEVMCESSGFSEGNLVFTTEITVYKTDKLTYNDCSLTLPYRVKADYKSADALSFTYHLGEKTGIEIAVLQS